MTLAEQKVVLLAAIRVCAEETGDWRNPVPLENVGAKLWPRRTDSDDELLVIVDALIDEGKLEPWPRRGYVKLAH